MKKLVSVLMIMIFALSSVPAFSAEEDYDPQHTMLTLNMAIVSIHRILSTQDRIILEQEYQNIINNLSLGNIESDYDLTTLFQDLMSLITRKRLREEETKIFQSRYDRREQNLLMDTLSGVRAYGGNLFSWLGSLAVSCASSYFSYQDSKAELAEDLQGDLWQLKREDIEDCNELQERLLNSSWNLLRQYKLPDNYRLVQRNMDDFYRAVNENDATRRLRMLRALEKDFQVYPPYWFYRARAAQEINDNKEAHSSFEKFNEVWRPVLRQDPYKVEAVKFRISEIVNKGNLTDDDKREILGLLEVMRSNTPREDWANNLFAGIAYFLLGEKDTGIEIVETNVDFGYEETLSNSLLTEMKKGRLDALTLYALKDDIRDIIAKVQTKQPEPQAQTSTEPMEKRKFTWEEVKKIAAKYGFREVLDDMMRRTWNAFADVEVDVKVEAFFGLSTKIERRIERQYKEFQIVFYSSDSDMLCAWDTWPTKIKALSYYGSIYIQNSSDDNLRNNPNIDERYIRNKINEKLSGIIPDDILNDTVAALMEIKNLE